VKRKDRGNLMNMDIITLEECEEQYEFNQCTTIISNGHIDGFEVDESQSLNTIYILHTPS
jgi:hypothetical protein